VPDDAVFPVFRDPSLLLIVVAGGGTSSYGAVMPGAHGLGRPVSRMVELDQTCEVPLPPV
jgi:hypothetical protein